MFTKAFLNTALAWVEHALIVAGIAALTDLGNNVSGLGLSASLAIIVGVVIGIALRFINKYAPQPTPPPPVQQH